MRVFFRGARKRGLLARSLPMQTKILTQLKFCFRASPKKTRTHIKHKNIYKNHLKYNFFCDFFYAKYIFFNFHIDDKTKLCYTKNLFKGGGNGG